ncbi:MAG TPA: adenylate/guanylate cyclase domain-containing protein [Candidatus Methylacidiphilales bacterium]|nr:adenylate/guanylate cyclase domain-containing protein [Candidatus Methylacidiphilales bacterium]
MEKNVGLQNQQSKRFTLFTSIGSLVGAIFLLQFSLANQLENRIYDFCFGLLHRYTPNPQASPLVGFVAIDDRSVDPDYSVYSSPMGRDGWVTRDLWNMHLQQMGQIFQPKVLAYDILFRPIPSRPVPAGDAGIKTIRDLEASGNQGFQNELCNLQDLRAAGQPAPRALFAFEFPDDAAANARLDQEEQSRQAEWFRRLDRFRLPEGSVGPGGTIRVYHSVRLPMDAILSAPSYFLGSINIHPDPDGIYRRIPMIYAYEPRPPDGKGIRYVPGFTLEAFLLWLGIEPQDLKKPGGGLPCLIAQAGGELKIETAQGTWNLPVDGQYCMPIVPRFVFRAENGAEEKQQRERFAQSFVDFLKFGLALQAGGRPEPGTKAAFTPADVDEARNIARITPGMILIVGEAYTGGTDMGDLPLEQEAPRSIVHMHALSNILQKDHLYEVSFAFKALLCVVAAVIMGWLYLRATPPTAAFGSLLLIICYPVLVIGLLMAFNLQLPLIAPSALAMFCFSLNSYDHYRQTRRGREVMRRLFSSVTSSRILRLLEENPEAFYAHKKTAATMLFSDVEAFTTLSENLDPGYLATLINRYLSPMTEIIVRHDGYLDKYSGDGIMAVWGVPLPDADHAYKACAAAWKQVQAALAVEEILPDGKPYRFRVRIGINTGMVSSGNMGSAQKMQYTVMGDAVNLAARLEPASKDYGTQIIIGPQTFAEAKKRIKARALDKIVVKGRSEAVLIYELLGLDEEQTGARPPWLDAYEQGLEQFWQRHWDEADRLFEQAARLRGGDPPSLVQRARIRQYRATPPPPDWQGEFTRQQKD